MGKYSSNLPQLEDKLFLADGGLETDLIFHSGMDLPQFASFVLLESPEGLETLINYFTPYADLAQAQGVGFLLDSPTWRSNPDWAQLMGYSTEELDQINQDAVQQLVCLRDAYDSPASPFVLNGVFGPRGDGYIADKVMTSEEAQAYHSPQMASFAKTDVDMVSAITMTHAEEAVGITQAAQAAGLPVAISFTVETDSRLPSGQPLKDAIEQVDSETDSGPAYFMLNCAHPTHFDRSFDHKGNWLGRIQGLRANASAMSHAELDEAEELDDGNPVELGGQYRELMAILPNLNVLGGCCGTDKRHIEAILNACRDI